MRRATSTARIGGPALVAVLVCITSLLWPDRARSDTPFYEVKYDFVMEQKQAQLAAAE
mgnify:CR=1 FL=1